MADAASNTSPLQYLHQLGRLELMPRLLGRVVVAPAVISELAAGHARGVRLPELARLGWVEQRGAKSIPELLRAGSGLDAGEIETIALAVEDGGLAVLDDGPARRMAKRIGIRYIGTLGLLKRAREIGLLGQLAPEFDRLAELGFRFDRSIRDNLLREVGEL